MNYGASDDSGERTEMFRLVALLAATLLIGISCAGAEEDTIEHPHCPTVCEDHVFGGQWTFKSGFDLCLVDQPCERHWWIEAHVLSGARLSISCRHNQYEFMFFPTDPRWLIAPKVRMYFIFVLSGAAPAIPPIGRVSACNPRRRDAFERHERTS
jgi:hypothetical protein